MRPLTPSATAQKISALAFAFGVLAGPALAQTGDAMPRPAEPKLRIETPDIQILESRQKRREFEDQQQYRRELDRGPIVTPPVRPEVPIFRGTCTLTNCR